MIQVSHPLRDKNMINERLDAISEILESMNSLNAYGDLGSDGREPKITPTRKLHQLLRSFLTSLGQVPDIQRGITRIFHRTAAASEVLNLFCM